MLGTTTHARATCTVPDTRLMHRSVNKASGGHRRPSSTRLVLISLGHVRLSTFTRALSARRALVQGRLQHLHLGEGQWAGMQGSPKAKGRYVAEILSVIYDF